MKIIKLLLPILLLLGLYSAVFAEDEFHSEFGFLPPEFPENSGMIAGQLNELVGRVDEESLPPSHRLRRLYEWMMRKFHFTAEDPCVADEQDPEAVSACLMQIIESSDAGDTGFAIISHYLLDRMGFPTVIISGKLTLPDGKTEEHRWNYVFYSGNWYHFDPLGEMRNPDLKGFMNVQKDLTGGQLVWDADSIPESGPYAVRAIGCPCNF